MLDSDMCLWHFKCSVAFWRSCELFCILCVQFWELCVEFWKKRLSFENVCKQLVKTVIQVKKYMWHSVLFSHIHLLMFRHFLTPQQTEKCCLYCPNTHEGHLYNIIQYVCVKLQYTQTIQIKDFRQTHNRQAFLWNQLTSQCRFIQLIWNIRQINVRVLHSLVCKLNWTKLRESLKMVWGHRQCTPKCQYHYKVPLRFSI